MTGNRILSSSQSICLLIILSACITTLVLFKVVPITGNFYHKLFVSSNKRWHNETRDGNCISDHVLHFLSVSKRASRDVFLVEPSILKLLLKEKDVRILRYRRLMPDLKDCHVNQFFQKVTFGIRGNVSTENLCSISAYIDMGFMCDSTSISTSTAYPSLSKQLRGKYPETVITHYFFLKSNQIIHLVVFYLRSGHYYWIGSIPKTFKPFAFFPTNAISFGLKEQAFNAFSLQSNVILNLDVNHPRNVRQFMSEVRSSRFIECKAKEEKEVNSSAVVDKNDIKREATRGLIKLSHLMAKLGQSFWLTSRTLREWRQQCDVSSHASDMYFGTRSWFPYNEIARQLNSSTYLNIRNITTVALKGFQVTFQVSNNLSLNLLIRGTQMMNMSKQIQPSLHFNPNLCSAEFLRQKVLVPCSRHP